MRLRVKEIAERLDISPAFASSLVKQLVGAGFASRARDDGDRRATHVAIIKAGIATLHAIDEAVHVHVEYFNRLLTRDSAKWPSPF